MRLKLYRAASVASAMAQVRDDLGPEALILSTRRTGEGVELTAALEPDDEPIVPTAPAQPASRPVPLAAQLAYHAVPEQTARRLAGPDLLAALGSLLRFGDLPIGARPLLFAGLPGAGKTLSVARLATRLVMAGTRPVVITADGRRAGAAEELAAYTRLLGLDLMVAGTPASLVRALATPACRDGAPVLLDTSGINPHVAEDVAGLAELAQAADAIPILVMAAGGQPEEAVEQAQAFAPLGARHLLPTRLDLVRRLGSVIAVADRAGLLLTEAAAGPGATDPMLPITPAFFAARLATGGDASTGPSPPIQAAPLPHCVPAMARRPAFPPAKASAAVLRSLERHG